MKKLSLITILIFVIAAASHAQKALDENTKIVSFGVGIGSRYWSSVLKSTLPVNPTLNIEKSLGYGFSAGTTFIYSAQKYPALNSKLNALYLGGRAAYHFEIPKQSDKVDLYAGAGLGYAIVFVSSKNEGATAFGNSGLAYNFFGGGRYYFAKKTAVYAELGYGSFSILNLGLTLKIQ